MKNVDDHGKYVISETPWLEVGQCYGRSELEIEVQHETEVSLASMGQRYCFSQGKIESMTETIRDDMDDQCTEVLFKIDVF